MFDSLAEYPHWFVITCAVLVVGVFLWVLMRLVKMALWAFFFAVLVAGLIAAAAFFLR